MSIGLSSRLETKEKHFAICVFNRASYSRCKALIQEMNKHPNFKVTVVLSSSLLMEEFGNAKDYIQKDYKEPQIKVIPIDYPERTHLGSALATAQILSKFSSLFDSLGLDAVILVADRFETLGAAIAASYLRIPTIHLQGGEVTGNIDEKVRHAVTMLSDYHFVSTDLAHKYVRRMGQESTRVYKTGCPSLDLVTQALIKRRVPKEKYIVCQFHPDTNEVNEAFDQTKALLDAVIDYCKSEAVHCYWYWPNPDPGREEIVKLIEKAHKEHKTYLIKAINKPPESFLYQLAGAKFMIGNSSAGIRECSFIGVPAINVGDRQSVRERSWNVIDCSFENQDLMRAIYTQHNVKKYPKSNLYGNGQASRYIVEQLSKIDFTIKDHITYPHLRDFYNYHFGEDRFGIHRKKRKPIGREKNGQAA